MKGHDLILLMGDPEGTYSPHQQLPAEGEEQLHTNFTSASPGSHEAQRQQLHRF